MLTEIREHQWQHYLDGQTMAGLRWRVLCKLPLPMRSGDLQWRALHGALATNVFRSKVDGDVGRAVCSVTCLCLYFMCYCHRLLSLLSPLSALCGKMGVGVL